ncbi:MAG: undecaprenyl-phosphate glucose phosphotransferase [Phycisphaerae bacterium]|nr:undecaprenyl-phosphate glucose phosphotransferase [Phycisphaerae bacterium]
MLRQRHRLFVTLLGVADGAVIAAACGAAWVWTVLQLDLDWPERWSSWIRRPLVGFVVPIVLVAMWMMGVYRARRDRPIWKDLADVVKASMVALIAIVVMLWAGGSARVGAGTPRPGILGVDLVAQRYQLATLALVLPAFLGAHRAAFRLMLRRLRAGGKNLRHVAIIGDERLGQIVARTLDRNSWTGINVTFFVSHHEHARRAECAGRPVHGGLAQLEPLLDQHRPDAVYLAVPNKAAALIPKILKRLDRYAVDVRIVPDVHPRYLPQSMAVSELDGMPVLSYRECPVYGLGGLTKRALDMLGAGVGLAVFAPLMAVVALLVARSGPGPIVFRQRRVSLGGEEFNIYKFRTMVHAEDERGPAAVGAAAWTARADPRVTPVGRFLRRTSLDELPQLVNVLKGQMSLVGPRPERPELITKFRDDWRGYMLRQHVKAGMTGWAQVNGHRGDTGLRKRLQYDLFYIRNWSLGFDLKILWMTLFRGFVHPNAH